jgi:hypothetical protein
MPRKTAEQYPLFPGTIPCLTGIMGATGVSGLNPGLEAGAKLAVFSPFPERFSGEIFLPIPES